MPNFLLIRNTDIESEPLSRDIQSVRMLEIPVERPKQDSKNFSGLLTVPFFKSTQYLQKVLQPCLEPEHVESYITQCPKELIGMDADHHAWHLLACSLCSTSDSACYSQQNNLILHLCHIKTVSNAFKKLIFLLQSKYMSCHDLLLVFKSILDILIVNALIKNSPTK